MAEIMEKTPIWEDNVADTLSKAHLSNETVLYFAETEDGLIVTGAANCGAVLEIPEAVEGRAVVEIGTSAFQGTTALRSVLLPEGLRRIGRCAFQGCVNLAEVKLPARMERIGESAFQGCASLEIPRLPEGLEEIANRVFYGCASLKRVDIPEGVLSIGERAFAGCKSLADALLPEGLRYIGERAFWDCPALRAVRVPASVTELSANSLPRAAMRDGQFYLRPQAMLVRAEVKRDYTLPQGTRSIAGWALAGNDALLSVDFGEALESVGPYALADCACLKRAILPPSVREVGKGAFSGCERMTGARLSPNLRTIPAEAFLRCRSLEKVEGLEGIETVGERAFEDCRSLKSLALPEGVRRVGERAFYRCASLERLELPASLVELGEGAVSGCAGLRALVLRGFCGGEMQAVLSEARRTVIVAPTQPPEAFPGLWRKRVCLGYALAVRESIPYAPEVARACLDWMRAHSAAFVAEALRDKALMHLLADGDCLSLEAVQALLDRADGPDRDEYYATLLAYRNRRFGGEAAPALTLW